MPAKIRRRGDSWEFVVSLGSGPDGKRQFARKTVAVADVPAKDVDRAYSLFAAEAVKGKVLLSGTERMTLKQFFDYWQENHADSQHEKSTQKYNKNLFVRIEKTLGHLRIDKIQPKHVLEFLKQMREPDAAADGSALSPTTIRQHFSLLKNLLGFATKWKFIVENPCEAVTAPQGSKTEKVILSKEDAANFLRTVDEHASTKQRCWVYLALCGGLRREEIFGLKWADFDAKTATITIRRAVIYVAGSGIVEKGTKSETSARKVSIPAQVVKLLESHRQETADLYKRRAKRKKVVQLIDPTGPTQWVFKQPGNTVGHPHSFNTFLGRFCEEQKLPPVGPHQLRHMAASYLLRGGVDLAAVSKKLGHANAAITAKVYLHGLVDAETESAAIMGGILDDLKVSAGKRQ